MTATNTTPRAAWKLSGGFFFLGAWASGKARQFSWSGVWATHIRRNGSLPHGTGKVAAWFCRCECGATGTFKSGSLRSGNTTSCGCKRRDTLKRIHTKHGKKGTPEYGVWIGMTKRCTNPNEKDWAGYGGRGIRVCERWRASFANFLADMGQRPTEKHTIEREDNDGDYSPDNCRWATRAEQVVNQRSNRILTFKGRSMPVSEWAKVTGINYGTLLTRITRLGWSVKRALSTVTSSGK